MKRKNKNFDWELVTLSAEFAPRDGAGLLSNNGKMWLLGGWNPNDKVNFPMICNSEVWSSGDGIKWELETKQAPWEGRHTAGYVVHKGRMWIVGGDGNQHHYQSDIWNSKDGVNWNLVTDNVPWGKRVLHHTLSFKEKIWVMGGQTLPQFVSSIPQTIFYNDVWSSEDGVNWELVTSNAEWEARGMIGGNAILNGRMWLLGGGTYDTPEFPVPRKYFNDVWSSTDGLHWERHIEHSPWQGRSYHDVASYNGKLWVMEGTVKHTHGKGCINTNDVWYSKDGVNWTEMPKIPWAPRHAASVVVHKDALWMIAGNNMSSDVWKLQPSITCER